MKEQDDKASANALDRRGQNECARFRESISASLDAEDTDIRDAAIDDHLNQ